MAQATAHAKEASKTSTVAIVGNPNAGKTTLFNALTGAHQKVANYPGVTVEKVTGSLKLDGRVVEIYDIPGLYSMRAVSEDEAVASRLIMGEDPESNRPDLLICTVDASSLERNLYLYAQFAEIGLPVIVVLTMVDRLEKLDQLLDLDRLRSLLGAPVLVVDGHRNRGLAELRLAIGAALDKSSRPEPEVLDVAPLFAGDVPRGREELAQAADRVPLRYAWTAEVARLAVRTQPGRRRKRFTDRVDRILTHRIFGFAVFAGVMYLVFQSIYSFARPLMDGIQGAFDSVVGFLQPHLAGIPVLQSFVCDGMLAGMSAMLQFLPQILILFFFISVLEGTGYLARAAFLMDRLLGWCGLNGRAFIPLLSSFACAIPGIMAARVMPDSRSRLATILVAPLMSCSARLPVYVMLIGAFIEPRFGPVWAGVTLFGMHLLGLAVAIPIAWIMNRTVIKGKRLPFVLELPPYQWPKWRDVALAMYSRGRVFVTIAGTTIVATSVIVWALSYFPRSDSAIQDYRATYANSHPEATSDEITRFVDQRQLAQSYLGRIGRGIEPVFRPAGFDWRITTGILSAFPARENIVPALGIIFSLGHNVEGHTSDLRSALQTETWDNGRPLLTPYSAVGLMVFFALCCQCMSTLATVRRETNSWKWPVFMFSYMTGLAYIGAVGVYQLGRWLGT